MVDGDGMGCAFPEFQMTTFNIYDADVNPFVMSDDFGNTVMLTNNAALRTERYGRTLAIVLDLFTILDRESGEPITTENLGYDQSVKVVAVAATQNMRSDKALAVIGPRAFGIEDTSPSWLVTKPAFSAPAFPSQPEIRSYNSLLCRTHYRI